MYAFRVEISSSLIDICTQSMYMRASGGGEVDVVSCRRTRKLCREKYLLLGETIQRLLNPSFCDPYGPCVAVMGICAAS